MIRELIERCAVSFLVLEAMIVLRKIIVIGLATEWDADFAVGSLTTMAFFWREVWVFINGGEPTTKEQG